MKTADNLFVSNVRLGFATNSSSSHSIVFSAASQSSERPALPLSPVMFTTNEFGWENFALTSQDDKLNYLVILTRSALVACGLEIQEVCTILRDLFAGAVNFPADDETFITMLDASSIDHQSLVTMGDDVAEVAQLAQLMVLFMSMDNVTVYGGNDNDGDDHTLTADESELPCSFGTLRAKYDALNNAFVMFNAHSGAKVRYKLENEPYVKGDTPELVDIKITDFCNLGCEFCYQNSTAEGAHAPLSRIQYIADVLQRMSVFEVALGGGETTSHPMLKHIIKTFGKRGIKVNFTTRTCNWLSDAELRAVMGKYVGAFGVSVDSPAQLRTYEKIKHEFGSLAVMQIVVGATPPETFRALLIAAREMNAPLLLLGWKNVGRGLSYAPYDVRGVLEEELPEFFAYTERPSKWAPTGVWKDYAYHATVSIDTAFAEIYAALLQMWGVSEMLVTTGEGAFSCYIDAVNMTVAKSSYSGDPISIAFDDYEEYTPQDSLEQAIRDAWKSF